MSQFEEKTPEEMPATGLSRRKFVVGSSLAGLSVPILAACAAGGGGGEEEGAAGNGAGGGSEAAGDPDNPFGVDPAAPIEVIIFNGGYGDQYGIDAGEMYSEKFPEADVTVSSTVNIQPEMQPRFVGGNPPDLIHNAGAQKMNMEALIAQDQVEEISDLLGAPAIGFEGQTVEETLVPGAVEGGTYAGDFRALPYVYNVFALWHSASEFEEKGWEVPRTWDELMALGETVAGEGRHLFAYGGQNASDYYQEMALTMAAKMGGPEVLQNIDQLEPDAMEQEAVVAAYQAVEDAVNAGYFMPGGAGITHTDAQTQWVTGNAVMYPSGSWIENEQADVTPEGYQMTGVPTPSLTDSDAMPYEAYHGSAAENYIVPSDGQNVPGAKEFLRIMLSQEAATNFTELTSAPTIVQGTVPEDGFGSSALASVNTMMTEGGDNVVNYRFHDWYGLGPELVGIWTQFLSGGIGADDARSQTQAILDRVREDDAITKFA